MSRRQGIFWILTIPHSEWVPWPQTGCQWLRGQLELGVGGFLHWQVVIACETKKSLIGIREMFGPVHAELTRSESCAEYVWKEDTRVAGTQFEFGSKPIRRNVSKDWEEIWDAAKRADLMAIPASIRLQSYRTIRAIASDFAEPVGVERVVRVFWGSTGTGKSRAAWEAAGLDAYPKDPRTKFWCGYRGQERVIIDEFRGGIDIAHMLRWLDRYPVIVEIKGGSVVLAAREIWITSNLSPDAWYPELDEESRLALRRRLIVTQFHQPL